VIVARVAGFQSRVLTTRVSSGNEADVGTLVLRIQVVTALAETAIIFSAVLHLGLRFPLSMCAKL